jgi:deoxyribonuclease V
VLPVLLALAVLPATVTSRQTPSPAAAAEWSPDPAAERPGAAAQWLVAATEWPDTAAELLRLQQELGRTRPGPQYQPEPAASIGGCFVCFAADERAFAGAALLRSGRVLGHALVTGQAPVPYQPGLLALREGALLERALRRLPEPPDLVLVNATGRDHPRGFGLAAHLGMVLGLPTVGVTDRPLLARGGWPPAERGTSAPLTLAGEVVGAWVRTRGGVRPVAAHAGWLTSAETAVAVTLRTATRARTPEPLRRARETARRARGRHR